MPLEVKHVYPAPPAQFALTKVCGNVYIKWRCFLKLESVELFDAKKQKKIIL